MALKLALILLFLGNLVSASDIRLKVGSAVTIGSDTITCEAKDADVRMCPTLYSSDPNLANCSAVEVGSFCRQSNNDLGWCRQPNGGPDDWCVCM